PAFMRITPGRARHLKSWRTSPVPATVDRQVRPEDTPDDGNAYPGKVDLRLAHHVAPAAV
ncbi:MAG: hypothetical protein NT176_12255, partial [Proteobacteria bacterium]|nr:hypothetical protein [Pseudomonadota bacterium]